MYSIYGSDLLFKASWKVFCSSKLSWDNPSQSISSWAKICFQLATKITNWDYQSDYKVGCKSRSGFYDLNAIIHKQEVAVLKSTMKLLEWHDWKHRIRKLIWRHKELKFWKISNFLSPLFADNRSALKAIYYLTWETKRQLLLKMWHVAMRDNDRFFVF